MKKLLLLLPLVAMFAISSCSDDDDNGAPAVEGLKLTPETADVFTKISKTLPTLELVVTPAEASDQATWTSDKPDVISVDAKGKLTLVKESTAKVTITVSAPSGQKATCVINLVDFSELTAGGYGFIDAREELGMLLLDRNLGATEAFDKATKKPESIGNYYQWGKNTPVAVGADAAVNANYDKEWNATGGSFKDWSVAANTPCPAGWSIPNQAEMKLITDKAWADYDGMTDQTDEEFEAAKALYTKLAIARGGHWRIQGADAAARTANTPDKYLPSAGYWWSGALNTTDPTSARSFKNAYTLSDNYDIMLGKKGGENEVNNGLPIRCIKVID